MLSLRRAIAASSPLVAATSRHTSLAMKTQRPLQRFFSSDPTIRRPKAIKIKKGEARRRVEPKPRAEEAAESNALVEQQEHAQVPAQYSQGPFAPQQPPRTFGAAMKDSFFWGIGMAIAFTFVGLIFGRMEEADAPGVYERSSVVSIEMDEGNQHGDA